MDNQPVPGSGGWKEEARCWIAMWKEHLVHFQKAIPAGCPELAASAQELLDHLEALDDQVEGSLRPTPGLLLELTGTVSAVAALLGEQLDGPAG
ncbi:MAG: hypothetical protein AB1445_10150 [Bacillota bacterium]